MPNSTLKRAAETKHAVVVLPRHNNNSFILFYRKHLSRPNKIILSECRTIFNN